MTLAWLVAGLLLGLAAALYSLLDTGRDGLPENTVARVNERYISKVDYARALSAVVTDSDRPLTDAQRRHILNRLIDEELLIQYGIDQGLVRSDRRVRANLVSAVLAAKSAAAETAEIPIAEARVFYQEHRNYFSRPRQLQVTLFRLADPGIAEAVRQTWQEGAGIEQLQSQYQLQRPVQVPNAPLPVSKLRQLIGASLTDAAVGMRVGEISPVLPVDDAVYLLRVDQRRDDTPPFEQVAEQVRHEMRRRNAEAAVREALQRLREEHQVVIAEDRLQ